jgi:hypothetical protein
VAGFGSQSSTVGGRTKGRSFCAKFSFAFLLFCWGQQLAVKLDGALLGYPAHPGISIVSAYPYIHVSKFVKLILGYKFRQPFESAKKITFFLASNRLAKY